MNRDITQGYITGMVVGILFTVTLYALAHIDNGFLFFLATWPTTVALAYGGLWIANKNIWRNE